MSEEQQPPVYETATPAPAVVHIEKCGGSGWKWFWIVCGLCFIVSILVGALVCYGMMTRMTDLLKDPNFQTKRASAGQVDETLQFTEVLMKEARSTGDKVLMIPVEGVIMDAGSPYAEGIQLSSFKGQLKKAGQDRNVIAVVLKVDSPGGDAFLCDLMADAIREFQEKYKKPVISWIGSMGASGGYYISAPCQWIVAHEMSLTGSIGVISSSVNYRGLMDKVGVKPVVYKSGKFKDMLRGSKAPDEILPEETKMMQGLIDKMYLRFKDVVRNGRGQESRKEIENARPLAADWESFADGRILMGSEAYDAGLVDELGSEEEVMAAVRRLTKGEGRPQVIRYESPMDWRGILKFFAQSHTPGVVKVELNGLNINGSSVMEPGKLYFLPPGE